MNDPQASRPLPTEGDALDFAREMVPSAKWKTITVVSGTTDDGGDGILLRPSQDCWIISYDPSPTDEILDEKMWVDKTTGVVVKMVLDE